MTTQINYETKTESKLLFSIVITDKDYRYQLPQNINGEDLMRKLSVVFKDLYSKNSHLSRIILLSSFMGEMNTLEDLITFRDTVNKMIENAQNYATEKRKV